jgi:hypothetical protein
VFNLVLLVVLILLAVGFMAAPLRNPMLRGRRKATRLEELQGEKSRTLEMIRDLEFDHHTGKVLDDDYRSSVEGYRAQAIQIMKEMDSLVPRQNVEDSVEGEITRIRKELKKVSES